MTLRIDPVAPQDWVDKQRKRLAGQHRMVYQNGVSHCSLAQASLCTAKIVRAYLAYDTLPPLETTCAVDEGNPWLDQSPHSFGSDEDDELFQALSDVADAW
jgi:hypothetical protein